MNKYFLLTFLLCGFIWSCSDSELITPGDEFLNVTNPGTFKVDVDGATQDFSYNTGADSNTSGSYINGAGMSGNTISLTLPSNLSTGVHTQANGARISINFGADGLYTNIDEAGQPLALSINISQVNNSLGIVTGTFSGTVFNPVSGLSKTLTNGQFYQIEFQPTVTNDRILKGDFNGTPFNFSKDASATGVASAAVISGFNVDQIQNLMINVPNGIAVGSYNEENNVKITVKLGTSNNPNDLYTNYNATTDEYLPVTLNITQITENGTGRVKGTFTGTITKFANGQPTGGLIEITNGQIDVPILIP